MNSIRAIVFDLYGVLGLNGWQSFKTKHFAAQPDRWVALRALGQQVDAGLSSDDEFVQAIARETNESPETVRYQFEHTQPNIALLEFIEAELGQYKIGLLSNASHDVMDGIFTPEQQQLFDAVILSAFVGVTKPDPRSFQMICNQLGVQPTEVLMVDDQKRHLAKALELGMATVEYKSVEQVVAAIRSLLGA